LPSEYLGNNGAQENQFTPMFCPRERLNRLLQLSSSKKSKLIIQTDPLGE